MFRTELNSKPSLVKMAHKDAVFTIGSCFSDNMAQKLELNKFRILGNPFGTVYNPLSIFKLLDYAIESKTPDLESYVENDGLFANYDFHSSFSSLDKKNLESNISNQISLAATFIKETNWLIITFGTAYVYERQDTGNVVANCHKIPSSQFTKRLLTQKQILEGFQKLWASISKVLPKINIILTVSPVRHIKDTLELNSVSKATLRLSCHTLAQQYDQVSYFPSYEIMMDDLRDYRFYKSDMIHPSDEAENYIWNKFSSCWFDQSTLTFIEEWTQLRTAINHKPFNPESEKHQAFIKQTIDKIKKLDPTIDFNKELEILNNQLI
jgi:hypothetical protein